MLELAPLVEAGLNAKKAQQARAHTPRVKLDNGKTIDEIIADLALSREHREETAEELWPHFFALFARPIRCSAFRLGVPQLALPTSWPTLPSADACAPVRSPCGSLSSKEKCGAKPRPDEQKSDTRQPWSDERATDREVQIHQRPGL
jgi:hypothetical protein